MKTIAAFLLGVLIASSARAADTSQADGYRVAVQRAIFLDDAARAARPEIPGNFQDMMRAQLCTKNSLSGALEKSSIAYQDACEVLDSNVNALCPPGTCVSLRVSPQVFGNADLRRKTEAALKNPCAYYLPEAKLKALSDRIATESGRKQLLEEYGRDISSDLANQRDASAAFKCSAGGIKSRKIALSYGDEVSVLVVE